MVMLMNVSLTEGEGASCQQKDCFGLRILPDLVNDASDRCAYVRKANTWIERLLSQFSIGSSRRTKWWYLQRDCVRIDDCQWSCANTIVAKLAVALAPMPFMRVLLDRFVAATSGVFPDNQELQDRGKLSGSVLGSCWWSWVHAAPHPLGSNEVIPIVKSQA